MFREKRRAERIKIELPVSVVLLDKETGTTLAGPVEGEARDFSPMGIALSLANIMLDQYHLFFTCQDNPAHILRIGFSLPDNSETVLNVTAKPVWYDIDRESEEKRVLLGLEFLLKPQDSVIKKLIKSLSAQGKTSASWLKIF